MDIFEILEAWVIAGNPSPVQKELANKRAVICNECEFKKQFIKRLKLSTICDKCGCPLAKKIYTKRYNVCPMHKWSEVDKDYFSSQKTNKTIL